MKEGREIHGRGRKDGEGRSSKEGGLHPPSIVVGRGREGRTGERNDRVEGFRRVGQPHTWLLSSASVPLGQQDVTHDVRSTDSALCWILPVLLRRG